MKCKKCGNEIKDGMKFCTYCGTPLEMDGHGTEDSSTPSGEESRLEHSAEQEFEEQTQERKLPDLPVSESNADSENEQPESECLQSMENLIICPECSQPNDSGSVFCTNCGASLSSQPVAQKLLSNSGQENQKSGKMCPQCHALVTDEEFCSNCGFYLKGSNPDSVSAQVAQPASETAENPVYCSICGAKNAPNSHICVQCGHHFEDEIEPDSTRDEQPLTSSKGFLKLKNRKSPDERKSILVPTIAVIALAFCLFGSWFLIDKACDPKKMVEKYFVSLVNGDYERAFDCLNISETELVNPEQFKEYVAGLDLGNVSNYQIIEVGTDSPSLFQSSSSDSEKGNTLGKDYVVKYRNLGDSEDQMLPISVSNSLSKQYLFFDKWTVGYDQIVCDDLYITVPVNSELKLNDVTVPDSMLDSNQNSNGSDAVYHIPSLFMGTYNVDVSKEGFEDIETILNVSSSDGEFSFLDMTLSESNVRALQKQAVEDMQKIYSAAIQGKPFTEISDLFSPDSSEYSYIQDYYNSLRTALSQDRTVSSLQIRSVEAYSDSNEPGVMLRYSYVADYKNNSGYSAGESRVDDDSWIAMFNYVSYADEWRLERLPSLNML